jgi:amidohydrolase
VAQSLRELPLEVFEKIGGHGVAGVLRNGDGPCLLLRADMDALPVEEKTGLPYASKKVVKKEDGTETHVTHACGHDMHVSCVLGAARFLVAARSVWKGTVVFVFQPAEENFTGARAMVQDGLYDKVPKPDFVLGQHTMSIRAGAIALSPGPVLAASDSYSIRIFGRGGHGGKPHMTIDPIMIAAYFLVRIQSIVSREVAPQDVAVITCGRIKAGTVANVIPDHAELDINVRTYRPEVREQVLRSIKRILSEECAASGAPEPAITQIGATPALVNSDLLVRQLLPEFSRYFDRVEEQIRETASEDFSVLADAVGAPYAFWYFGITDAAQWDEANKAGKLSEIPGQHSPFYAPVIQPSIKAAVDAMSVATLVFLGNS